MEKRPWWEGKKAGDFVLGTRPKLRTTKSQMTKDELRALKTAITHHHMSALLQTTNSSRERQSALIRKKIIEMEAKRVKRVKVLSGLPPSSEDSANDASAFSTLSLSHVPDAVWRAADLPTNEGIQLAEQGGSKFGTSPPVYHKYTWVQRAVLVFTHLHHLLGNANFGHTTRLTRVKRSR